MEQCCEHILLLKSDLPYVITDSLNGIYRSTYHVNLLDTVAYRFVALRVALPLFLDTITFSSLTLGISGALHQYLSAFWRYWAAATVALAGTTRTGLCLQTVNRDLWKVPL